MSMPTSRISAFVLMLLLLSSCGQENETPVKKAEKAAQAEAMSDGKVECALAGSAQFEDACTADRISGAGSQILVLRHPDGGFRRFNILTDGRGLEPADGFDETRITILDNGMIEVSSGDDKYRLPAQIKPAANAASQ